MEKPEEKLYKISAVDGAELCEYIAQKLRKERGFDLGDYDVELVIIDHKHNDYSIEADNLFELIIEEEDYCNGDNPEDIREAILQTIAEEFGGHFNINFLSVTAYL